MAELNFSLKKVYWKEEAPVDVTPTTEPQTVTPEAGQAFNKVNVGAIPPEYVVPEGTENITANGKYNVKLKEFAHVAVEPNLDSATVVPTKQKQTVEPRTGYDGLSAVTVNPIPPEYVVPTGSVDITQNGTVPVSGKATANVNVPQGVFPSGTKLITENVTGEDVTNYAAVDVAVPGPSGKKQISITANGTTTEDVTDYAAAEIKVSIPSIPQSDFVKIHHEVITVGENNISNGLDAYNFLSAAKTINGTVFAASIKKKDTYDYNEFVYCYATMSAYWRFCRYRNGFMIVDMNTGYDVVLTPGAQYDIYTYEITQE